MAGIVGAGLGITMLCPGLSHNFLWSKFLTTMRTWEEHVGQPQIYQAAGNPCTTCGPGHATNRVRSGSLQRSRNPLLPRLSCFARSSAQCCPAAGIRSTLRADLLAYCCRRPSRSRRSVDFRRLHPRPSRPLLSSLNLGGFVSPITESKSLRRGLCCFESRAIARL